MMLHIKYSIGPKGYDRGPLNDVTYQNIALDLRGMIEGH